jgi:SWI/SNF-related matrix-associated actin-dependent regulator of chromatin subfamily A-like protein 1
MNLEPYALYPHQVTGVEFLTRRGRAILGDDMGLGKIRQAERLRAVPWTGVALDEAHFIKNASQRSSQALKILGVSDDKRAGVSGPRLAFLLTGTPMPNRPRDLFNLLRAVGHPAARSFIAFARQYCGAYRNNYGWVTEGASNLAELNLLLKEVMLRRKKDDVLDLPPKIRSWVPVQISGESAQRHRFPGAGIAVNTAFWTMNRAQ